MVSGVVLRSKKCRKILSPFPLFLQIFLPTAETGNPLLFPLQCRNICVGGGKKTGNYVGILSSGSVVRRLQTASSLTAVNRG